MRVHRAGKQPHQQFAMVPNETARDERLSFRARGILTFLLSQQEGWDITTDSTSQFGREGRGAVRTAYRELESAGYVRRTRERSDDGQWSGHIYLYPYGDAPPMVENQSSENRSQENQSPENRRQVSRSQDSRSDIEDQEEDHEEDVEIETAAGLRVVGEPPTTEVVGLVPTTDDQQEPVTPGDFPAFARAALPNITATEAADWRVAWGQVCDQARLWEPVMHLTKYLATKRERSLPPIPTEWLRWFIEDETRARREAAAETAEPPEPWYERGMAK